MEHAQQRRQYSLQTKNGYKPRKQESSVRKQWEFSRFSWSSQPHAITNEQTEVICHVVSGISSYLYQFLTDFSMQVHVCWAVYKGDFESGP